MERWDSKEDVNFELASILLISKSLDGIDAIGRDEIDGDVIIYDSEDEIITASVAPLWTGETALFSFLDGSSWNEVIEGFEPQLLSYFQTKRTEVGDDFNGSILCTVGINIVFEKSFSHYYGSYEYDAYAYIVGIVDTSKEAWNADRFAYTVVNPSHIPGV